jgi:hypothetical protein
MMAPTPPPKQPDVTTTTKDHQPPTPERLAVARQFATFHKERVPDSVVDKWVAGIADGSLSMERLLQQLQEEQEQYHELRKSFREQYSAMVGDHNCDRVFAEMWRSSERVEKQHMREHIATSGPFRAKYGDMVRKVHAAIVKSPISEETLQAYLRRFVDDATYSVDVLCSELSRGVAAGVSEGLSPPTPGAEHQSNDIEDDPVGADATGLGRNHPPVLLLDAARRELGREPDTEETAVLGLWQTLLGASPDTLVRFANTCPLPLCMMKVLRDFRPCFGRCMTVQELTKYSCVGAAEPSAAGVLQGFHRSNWARARTVYGKYLDQDCSEDEFLAELLPHLSLTDDAANLAFFENLCHVLVRSDARYKDAMEHRIHEMSRLLHGADMKGHELDYAFRLAQANGAELMDDSVKDLVIGVRQESHVLMDRISQVFLEVLERPPDSDELLHQVQAFREAGSRSDNFAGMDERLTQQLLRSLEYHDVIKRHLREAYTQLMTQQQQQQQDQQQNSSDVDRLIDRDDSSNSSRAQPPPTTWLYQSLEKILHLNPCCVEDVHDAVRIQVQQVLKEIG